MRKPPIDLQDLRRRIYAKAKAEPSWRFWGLYVHVCKRETLDEAYALAKKNNGCLPPGQAKKRYAVGHPLASGIVVGELPSELSVRIGPAPAGYRYGILDGDLVKLAVGTMLVADVIAGLVQ